MLLFYNFMASTSSGSEMGRVVGPLVNMLCGIAGIVSVAFIVYAGVIYITSSGRPDRMENSKRILKEALLGLAIILGAAAITATLSHAYNNTSHVSVPSVPALSAIKPDKSSFSLVGLLVKAITGVLQNIIQSVGRPFIGALSFFTSSTPLMASNPSVFKLWLAVVGIADALFVLTVCMLGFHVMSATTLGLDHLDIKQMFPQIVLTFMLVNCSIFVVDAVISLSNGMISALHAGFGNISVWKTLSDISNKSSGMGLAALLIMLVFLVLTFILLVYYVGRLVTLYLGVVLAPLLLLLWLLPSFKDFAASAIRTYLTTIFVVFVHVIILLLAGSILSSLSSTKGSENQIMSLVVGLSTLVALIKTQGVMAQLNYTSIGPKSLRKLGSQFLNGLSHSPIGYKLS